MFDVLKGIEEWNKEGGPAFPSQYADGIYFKGMTKRDYFASKALNSILMQDESGIAANDPKSKCNNGESMAEYWARNAYEIADAMIAESEKVNK